MQDYQAFLRSKQQRSKDGGFEPLWMPDFLFDFQQYLVEWMTRRGRGALFVNCGLGKGPTQLTWAENVVRYTNRPVLVLCPLSVASQMVSEGRKFGIECYLSRDGKFPAGARIVVSNYEKIHYFNSSDFVGVSCDESGCLKCFDSVRKGQITEFVRTLPYRMLCTATPAPNDFIELGTHSEALGELGYMDMLSRFFKDNTGAGYMTHGGKYRFRGHAERDFWRWLCSWSRAARYPSDLGFSDERFILPPLELREHVVPARFAKPGRLFDTLALTNQEQIEDRRRTLPERCEKAAELLSADKEAAIAWAHLNDEGDLLTRLIPDAVQVSGADSDERKEEVFEAFCNGQIKKLVTKSLIAGFGLNFQHCAHMSFFPSHSFEQQYQAIRRCWRFGQTRPVGVELVTSEGMTGVVANLQRKSNQASQMFAQLAAHSREALAIEHTDRFTTQMEIPAWLTR